MSLAVLSELERTSAANKRAVSRMKGITTAKKIMSASYKPYLMLVILLLNQWFSASAMASHTMPMSDMAECNMAMSGAAHDMDMSDSVNNETEQTSHSMDCCDQDCSCPPSACSSAALLSLNSAKLNINSSFTLVNYQFSSLTVALSKFQKPPQTV